MRKKIVQRAEVRTTDPETGEVITTPEVAYYQEEVTPNYWKTPFNHDTAAEATRTGTIFNDESKTQQSYRDEADINEIMAKFGATQVRSPPMHFVDVPDDLDLATGIARIREGQQEFLKLPKNLQQHFETMDNYLDYIDQAAAAGDRKALEELNLVPPTAPPATPPHAATQGTPPAGGPPVPPAATPAPTPAQTAT